MAKIAVVTDTNSGMTEEEARSLGVSILPMPFTIDGKEYFEGINLDEKAFYEMQGADADIYTSQPSVGSIMELWDGLLKDHDEIVHIPMSSGLSGSCETATMLAEDYGGKVQVVNNQRISVTQSQSVRDAVGLVKMGKSAAQIKKILEDTRYDSTIYIMVDTLKFLKKGGRITPAAALLGTALALKPVLQIQGEKLDAFAKARNVKSAKRIMMNAIRSDLENRFAEAYAKKAFRLQVAYTYNKEAALELLAELKEQYPEIEMDLAPLSLSVSCHIGPGALAIASTMNLKELEP